MIFPQIRTKASNISMTPQLEELLAQKFELLGKLISEKDTVQCEVELKKLPEHHSGKIYRIEANLHCGGKLFRAEATEETIEQAIDSVRNELKHELNHAHGKRQSLFKRGRQAIKNMIRFGK